MNRPVEITVALETGLERARLLGYTRDFDVAMAIKTALREAGLKVVRIPGFKREGA
ncbi:MAG: hypothetical protein ACRD0K_10040 [Egibacteraceae bacterium]